MNFENELRLPAVLGNLERAMELITGSLEKSACSRKISNRIAVVTEELFVNICSYAYPGGTGDLVIRFTISGNKIYLQFEDSGVSFDPLKHANPDITLAAEDRQIGGLGIFITTRWMDSVNYQRTADGKNILSLTASWQPE